MRTAFPADGRTSRSAALVSHGTCQSNACGMPAAQPSDPGKRKAPSAGDFS
jgi:hypothetical protein